MIKVKPGKYVEGVIVEGKKFNGLTIMGTKQERPKKAILEGKNAKDPIGNVAKNGIEIDRRRERHGQEHVGPELRYQRRLLA